MHDLIEFYGTRINTGGLTLNLVPLRSLGWSLVGQKSMPITPSNPFKGRQFPGAVIILCVRFGTSDIPPPMDFTHRTIYRPAPAGAYFG
jgi:hypothetical protein